MADPDSIVGREVIEKGGKNRESEQGGVNRG